MRKIKTSISVEPDRLARLKRLAERERRSVSQLLDLAVEQLLPVLEHTDLTIEDLTAHPSPKSKRKRTETRPSDPCPPHFGSADVDAVRLPEGPEPVEWPTSDLASGLAIPESTR